MNIKIFSAFILILRLLILEKCPDASKDFQEDTRLKLGFEIESTAVKIIKDEMHELVKKNKNKNAKIDVDSYISPKSNKNWIFENDSYLGKMFKKKLNKEYVIKELKKQLNINFDKKWFEENVGINSETGFAYYTSEFHSVGGHYCDSIYKLIDYSLKFFVNLFDKYHDRKGLLEIVKAYQNSDLSFEEMNVEFIQFIDSSFDLENLNLDNKFLIYYSNSNILRFFKAFIEKKNREEPDYMKFAKIQFKNDPKNKNLNKMQYETKLKDHINLTLTRSLILVDRPSIQATVQIPLEYYPTLMQKFAKEGKKDPIYTWLNKNCQDLNSATKELCLTIKSRKCKKYYINNKVLGLTLNFLQYLTERIFNKKPKYFQKTKIKEYFNFLPRTKIKEMYQNLSPKNQRIFSCIFSNKAHYKPNNILISYNTNKFGKINNKMTLKSYITSILENKALPDLLSPPPGLSKHYSLGSLPIPIDCKECGIFEIRTFVFLENNVVNSYYVREKGRDRRVAADGGRVYMKDVPEWFKRFSKSFFEMGVEEFVMKEERIWERDRDL